MCDERLSHYMHATSLALALACTGRIGSIPKKKRILRYNGEKESEHHCVHVAMDVAVKINVIISAVCIRQVMRQRNYSTLNSKVRTGCTALLLLLLVLMVAELESVFFSCLFAHFSFLAQRV